MKKAAMSVTMLFALGCFAQTSSPSTSSTSSSPSQSSSSTSQSTSPQSTSSGSSSSQGAYGSQSSGSQSTGSQSSGSMGTTQGSSTPDTTGAAGTQSSTAAGSQASTGKQKGEKTIKGCIAGSGGNFMLQDKKGKSVNLQSSQDLSAHVGHEVKLHGRWEKGAAASAGMGAEPSTTGGMASSTGAGAEAGTSKRAKEKGEKTFVVDNVEMVSDQCPSTSGATSPNVPK